MLTHLTCSIPECGSVIKSRGMCSKHVQRWRKYGDPTVNKTLRGEPLVVRFMGKVDQMDTCWLWRGHTLRGYGVYYFGDRPVRAHRVSYELFVGPIPAGLQLDHLCRVKHCVRPSHLEAVTALVNTMRGNGPAAINSRKTCCPRGHPYGRVNSQGRRWCRICANAQRTARRHGIVFVS